MAASGSRGPVLAQHPAPAPCNAEFETVMHSARAQHFGASKFLGVRNAGELGDVSITQIPDTTSRTNNSAVGTLQQPPKSGMALLGTFRILQTFKIT